MFSIDHIELTKVLFYLEVTSDLIYIAVKYVPHNKQIFFFLLPKSTEEINICAILTVYQFLLHSINKLTSLIIRENLAP